MLHRIIVAVQKNDFDLNSEMETLKLKTEKAGAVVIFVGKVRDLEDDNLKYLEIESFEELAKSQIKEICNDAANKWDLEYILVKHRFGRLKINDNIVHHFLSLLFHLKNLASRNIQADDAKPVVI